MDITEHLLSALHAFFSDISNEFSFLCPHFNETGTLLTISNEIESATRMKKERIKTVVANDPWTFMLTANQVNKCNSGISSAEYTTMHRKKVEHASTII